MRVHETRRSPESLREFAGRMLDRAKQKQRESARLHREIRADIHWAQEILRRAAEIEAEGAVLEAAE